MSYVFNVFIHRSAPGCVSCESDPGAGVPSLCQEEAGSQQQSLRVSTLENRPVQLPGAALLAPSPSPHALAQPGRIATPRPMHLGKAPCTSSYALSLRAAPCV